jgi:hypothetical protein
VVRYGLARGLASFRQGSSTYSSQPGPFRLSQHGFLASRAVLICSCRCNHLPTGNVGRSGRRKGRFSRRPIPCLCGGDPCLALRPCSIEVARTINQSTARKSSTAILDGQGLPLVRPELANGGGGKRKFEKGREGPMAALTILNWTTENNISPHLLRKCW